MVALAAIAALAGGPIAAAESGFAGPVDIGTGRTLFLNCQGTGSPTVLVIPGKGSYAEAWNAAVVPGDPVLSSPYDIIDRARIEPSPSAVQPTIARTTRICVYDRPDPRPDGADQSTPVAQPHTVTQDVDDVVSLIAAAGLSTPMVFVAHSYGALILGLLAREHPELVSGMVFTEPTSAFLPEVGSPAQNAAFDTDGRIVAPGQEAILPNDAFTALAGAPPFPRVPSIVLSADKFPPPSVLRPDNYTQSQIHRANDLLAVALGTSNVIVPGTGHNQMLYRPSAISAEIATLVERIRNGG